MPIEKKGDRDAIPESDPAYAIIMQIVRVVPVSHWAFARPEMSGELGYLLESDRKIESELPRLKSELKRQRVAAKTGPRIAATLGSLGNFESGITLLFADARANFGILTLLRTSELGSFTSSEISMLTLALDATSERLSGMRLNTPGPRDHDGSVATQGASYVLDQDLQIVMTWESEDQRRVALTGLRTRLADRLPLLLEETVRELIAGLSSDRSTHGEGIARPVPFLVVRTQPMAGPAGLFIGVRIDRFRSQNSLAAPAERFHISPRELQVLALLMDGAKLEEIAAALHITTSTIQDHIKSMVEKTGSRNRTELIARVLGWASASEVPTA
jgi:DNA-binding CsgD family transcriptional regulator